MLIIRLPLNGADSQFIMLRNDVIAPLPLNFFARRFMKLFIPIKSTPGLLIHMLLLPHTRKDMIAAILSPEPSTVSRAMVCEDIHGCLGHGLQRTHMQYTIFISKYEKYLLGQKGSP